MALKAYQCTQTQIRTHLNLPDELQFDREIYRTPKSNTVVGFCDLTEYFVKKSIIEFHLFPQPHYPL